MIRGWVVHGKQRAALFFMLALLLLCNQPLRYSSAFQSRTATLDLASSGLPLTLDPALAADLESLTAVENLFLALTDIDPTTGNVEPELATAWQVSPDRLIWTFTLRNDIHWMRYDPGTGTAETVRNVVAEDVIYGIKHACDPRTAANPNTPLLTLIGGCEVLSQTPIVDVTDDLVFGNTIQAKAPDDTTVMIALQQPFSYFLAVTPLIRPIPREAIEAHGLEWTAPGNLITNGGYFLDTNDGRSSRVFVRNHALPLSLQNGGNVDRVIYHIVPDGGTRLALYDDNTLDSANVDSLYVQNVLDNPAYTGQVVRIFDLSVYFFGFAHQKPPFDSVYVRRAFSTIIDRQDFIEQLRMGRGVPMIGLTPPGVPFAANQDASGVGFNVAYARQQMIYAGYPNCRNFPPVRIMTYPGYEEWGNFVASSAEKFLNCDASLFTIEPVVGPLALQEMNQADLWTIVWHPDYPDIHAWVGEALTCQVHSPLERSCTLTDRLLDRAAIEADPARRALYYADVEAAFFGPNGEHPVAPLFVEAGTFILVKPWISGPFTHDGRYAGLHWDAYRVDTIAKRAAHQENP